MYFTDILCCTAFEVLVFSCSKLVIDSVSGYVSAFFSLVGEFYVDIAPCWTSCCHVHA